MEKHVVVLAGGASHERDISLQTGQNCASALREMGYKVTILDLNEDFVTKLQEIKPYVVFNALHGLYGEDGSVPGLLDIIGIPYTHSGVAASAFCMNKVMTKQVLSRCGVVTPKWEKMLVDDIVSSEGTESFPFTAPYVVKAISQGSTFGVYIVKDNGVLFKDQILSNPWIYGQYALVEEYISGAEISVPVLRGRALGALELRPKSGFYDYEAKYTDGKTEHIYPANISSKAYDDALRYAEISHQTFGCKTISRSDFIYDKITDEVYFLETNTHPGFTKLSIYPEIASYAGISYSDLMGMLIEDALTSSG